MFISLVAAVAAVAIATSLAGAATFTGEQLQISQSGPNGSANFGASQAAVAGNTATGEHLVVWRADANGDATPAVADEFEIYGRLVGPGGVPKGAVIQISDMGPNGDPTYFAAEPSVAYNPETNEYLVVWRGSDDSGTLIATEFEIFGQRLSATGAELGTNDFRISDMGATDGSSDFRALTPSVAYSPPDDHYLVVWAGDDDTAPLVDGEFEIFGQLLNTEGAQTGADFRISDMGPDASLDFSASTPDVAQGSTGGGFMVSWHGDDDVPPLAQDEIEIFGQRLDGAGTELGANDFRVSSMGPDEDTEFVGSDSKVAFNPNANETLVVWHGDSDFPLDDQEFEIFGQRLSSAGNEVGADDFRISQMGPDGFSNFRGFQPDVTHNPADNQYLVVFRGDDNVAPLIDDEFEVFAQRLAADGSETGEDDFRISRIGTDGVAEESSQDPAASFAGGEYAIAWQAADSTEPEPGELEIFVRGLAGAEPPPEPIDDQVTLTIAGGKLVLTKKRTTKVKLTCPADEASPPCQGKLVLETRKKVTVAKKRKVTFARKNYSLDAGVTKRLKLKLSKRNARLIRSSKPARKVIARTTVSDSAGNSADVSRKLTLAPKRKKG